MIYNIFRLLNSFSESLCTIDEGGVIQEKTNQFLIHITKQIGEKNFDMNCRETSTLMGTSEPARWPQSSLFFICLLPVNMSLIDSVFFVELAFIYLNYMLQPGLIFMSFY